MMLRSQLQAAEDKLHGTLSDEVRVKEKLKDLFRKKWLPLGRSLVKARTMTTTTICLGMIMKRKMKW
jgi:hypothetical protein